MRSLKPSGELERLHARIVGPHCNVSESLRRARTIAIRVDELGMVVDRLLLAEDADQPELLVERVLGQGRLDDVGPVEAAVSAAL